MRSAVRAVPGVSSWTPSTARKSRAARAAASSRGASVSREQAARAAGVPVHRAPDRLELANCPFHALAQDETELVCGLDHCFVSGLAEETAPGELDARLEPDPQRCCVVVHRTSG